MLNQIPSVLNTDKKYIFGFYIDPSNTKAKGEDGMFCFIVLVYYNIETSSYPSLFCQGFVFIC